MLVADWQNPLHNLDVNDDSFLSPLDVLVIINDINTFGTRRLVAPFNDFSTTAVYLDSDGDGFLSTLDALLVINSINDALPSPPLDLRLSADSGASRMDLITNDPSVRGSAGTSASSIASAKIRVNRENVVDLPMDANGNFNFDPRSLPGLVEGATRIGVAVTLAAGGTGLRHLHFTYDATPPTFVPPHLSTADDSGASDSDNVTKITSPHLESEAEIGSQLVVQFNGLTITDLISTGSWKTELISLADGAYEILASATDVAGNISQTGFPVTVTIDTLPPPATRLDLATTSDTGIKGDHQTGATRVTLIGNTEGNAIVTLEGTTQTTRASKDGKFRLLNIALASGANTIISHVVDLAGNVGPDSQTIFSRIAEVGVTDPVARWNTAALEAIRLDATDPPVATRNLAMLSLAMFDVVNAVEGTPSFVVSLPPPAGISPEAAASSAAFEILKYAYPAQESRLRVVLSGALAEIPDNQGKTDGVNFGQSIAQAIVALRSADGWNSFVDYTPSESAGRWQKTAPMYSPAWLPQWANLQTFAIESADALVPSGPPDLTSEDYSRDFREVALLGRATGSTRTADQTQIARFWADGSGTYTPPGHWNEIAGQVAQGAGNSWGENARLFAKLNVALGDASIVAWDAKYRYEFWRPITAIHDASFDGNDQTAADSSWSPLLITPPFPEYISGHSTFSAAAAKILTDEFGSSFAFTTTSPGLPGIQRSFTSFDSAAAEAGRSRVFGGIHYEFSNQDGQTAGRAVADEVLDRFSIADDVIPPWIVFTSPGTGLATSGNPAIRGLALDNLSGVAKLQVAVDSGVYAAVTFDAAGRFVFQPQISLTGSADGSHVVHFRAIDHAGLTSATTDFKFVLDTLLPSVAIDDPKAGSSIGVGSILSGTANGTGAAVTSLSYQIDAGPVMPLSFNATNGNFSQRLDLSKVVPGSHTITVTVGDAAGLTTTKSLSVELAATIPFAVTSVTPGGGATDVGTTVRPKVLFSRPVRVSSLKAENFFATDSAGIKLSANIVPAQDGSFAWLFFQSPMPGGSTITVHLVGSTILAEADGQPLDADGDGTAGGTLRTRFTTVSRTAVLGTSLSGRVLDPGDDLKPMTFDDIRAGGDGILHTADDSFLHPLAGVKVFVLGLEGQIVTTDLQGNFHFDSVPAGNVKLAVDGRTATNAPAGLFFPEMVMDLNIAHGQANTVMGAMGTADVQIANRDRLELYLPRVQTSILRDVSTVTTTRIGVDALSAPHLTLEQRQLLSIEIQPGSLIDPDGNPLAAGQVGISAVPPELVRDMLPPGVLQHTFDITIQAPGITHFSTPAKLTFPNVFKSSPGTKLNFISFDHTTGRLVLDGTATVSADGLSVVTDPGQGITHPGWHGLPPPGGCGGTVASCPDPSPDPDPPGPPPPADPLVCDASNGSNGDGDGPLNPCKKTVVPTVILPFITKEKGNSVKLDSLHWTPPTMPGAKLTVKIEIDGPLSDFMKQIGTRALATSSTPFVVKKAESLNFVSKTYDQMFGKGGFAKLDADQLFGAKITVTEVLRIPSQDPMITVKTFYLYRWVTAMYYPETRVVGGNRGGNSAAFLKTLDDGAGAWFTTKRVNVSLPSTVTTKFAFTGNAAGEFTAPETKGKGLQLWQFDPTGVGSSDPAISIKVSEKDLEVGTLKARGQSIAPVAININVAGYVKELKRVLIGDDSMDSRNIPDHGLVSAWDFGDDGFPGKAKFDDDGINGKDDTGETGWPLTDDLKFVGYRYNRQNTAIISPFQLLDLRGPAILMGRAGTVKQYVLDPFADPNTYLKVASPFQDEFNGFMPYHRNDPGPDTIFGTFDDTFSASQLALLDQLLVSDPDPSHVTKANAMRLAVAADYEDADLGRGAFKFVDVGGDVTMKWHDLFERLVSAPGANPPVYEVVSGTNMSGEPIYGFADFDADKCAATTPSATSCDFNGDGIVLETVFKDPQIPQTAKEWALAQELNTHITNTGNFAVAINLSYTSTASFAQFVANTVSHELAHTFGLLDAYRDRSAKGSPGTARCNKFGNCMPYDIMRSGYNGDGDLTFKPSNIQILRAAMGIAVEGRLGDAVKQYRKTFNLTHKVNGIRENPTPSDQAIVHVPVMAAVAADQLWYDPAEAETLEMGEIVADGVDAASKTVRISIYNGGTAPLTVSSISLEKGNVGFSLENIATIPSTPIATDQTVEFVVRLDPSTPGELFDTINIVGNDPDNPVLRIPLHGIAFSNEPFIQASRVGSNNLGGATINVDSGVTSEIFKLVNYGQQPLIINGIGFPEGQGPFRLLGVPANLALQPITLARGQGFVFGARFSPEKLGLIRGLIEVKTNDPLHGLLRLSLVGTGLAAIAKADWGKDYVGLTTADLEGSTPLRTRSNDQGDFSLFLPSDASYRLTIFDPDTGMVGDESGITSPSGQFTKLGGTIVFGASMAPDSDYDGLPDDIEQTIGTSIRRTDTDGNGLDDFVEVMQGLDPLGGRAVATGIVAQLPLTGIAKKIVVEGATATNQAELAYIATGSGGLAIVDISQFAKPVLLAELDLPGDATDVSVDSARGIAAVAIGAVGLAVIDISTPTAPRLIRTINVATAQVEVASGIAYVADGSFVTSLDLADGSVLDQVYMGAVVGGLAREGSFLYATNASNVLTILDLSQSFLTRRGQILISTFTDDHHDGPLFVGGGIAYVMNTLDSLNGKSGGFATVNVSDPDLPKLISTVDHTGSNAPFAAVAANGSGLALLAGAPLATINGDRNPRLDLLDVSDPTNTYNLLRSIQLPSAPFDVLTAGGAAFVADGAGGLAVVNYLPLDVDGKAPELTIPVDPVAGGIFRQVFEGEPIRLPIQVRDDVQVRGVELLTAEYIEILNPELNKFTVVASDISFPFDVEIPAPAILPGLDSRTTLVRVRVTDTGGNVTTSAPVYVTSNRDNRPPLYLSHGFIDGAVRSVGLDGLSLFFSEPLRRDTVSSTTFRVLNAQNQPVPGFGVESIGGGAIVRLGFDALPVGAYRMEIDSPKVKDRSGLPLVGSQIVTRFTVVEATENIWRGRQSDPLGTGNWNDPESWSLGRVPGSSDLVSMLLGISQTVNFTSGIISVRALVVTGGTLALQGGTLSVADGGQVETLLIEGGRLDGTGDITITKKFSLTSGVLSGTGTLHIAAGGIGELSSSSTSLKLDGRPISVDGQLSGLNGSIFYYARTPVIEIRKGGTFIAANGFRMSSADGQASRLDLFGRFTTVAGASIQLGLELIVLPGGEFAPRAGRVELQGGGQFNAPLNLARDTILHLRGPLDATKPKTRYVLPSGLKHEINGPLLIGGADVIVGGDANVRVLDFAGDSLNAIRNGTITIDGTLTITERLGGGTQSVFGGNGLSFSGGSFQGKGELIIPIDATYNPNQQTFRGVTIRNRGTIDFTLSTIGFKLGTQAVFEHEGSIEPYVNESGYASYGDIGPGGTPQSVDEPFDRGTFNARVALDLRGGMRFFAVFNAFAGVTVNSSFGSGNRIPVEFYAGGTFHGRINVSAGIQFNLNYAPDSGRADLRKLSNIYTFAADSQVSIDGELRIVQSSVVANTKIIAGLLYFFGEGFDGVRDGVLTNSILGSGAIDITRQLNWQSGRIATFGAVTIKPTANLQIRGNNQNLVLDGTIMINQAMDAVQDELSQMALAHGAVFRNEGELHTYGNSFGRITAVEGGGRIDNYGNWLFFNNSINTGTDLPVDVPVFNFGTLRLNGPSSGGANAIRFSELENNGVIVIAPHFFHSNFSNLVEVRGVYRQTAAATLRTELTSTNPLFETPLRAGKLAIRGQAFLAGKLEIDFVKYDPGSPFTDRPTAGETYPLLTFASKIGDFSQKTSLDLANGFDYNLISSATSLTAVAKAVPQALRASSTPMVATNWNEPSQSQLDAIFMAAIDRWATTGLTKTELQRMRTAEIRVTDLDGDLLGLADGNVIRIDRDAAGWGWFIDSSPMDDEEFLIMANDVLRAKSKNRAIGRMDLLTAIMHELGHLTGLQDETLDDGMANLMNESLAADLRKLPR